MLPLLRWANTPIAGGSHWIEREDMRLYPGKVSAIAHDMVAGLSTSGDIEIATELVAEVVLDVESVLREYIRLDRDVTDRAREKISREGLEFTQLNKIKQKIAEERNFGVGDRAVEYITKQIIEALLHSRHVAEVFGEDNVLRRSLRDVINRHTHVDDDLDQEVRRRIKNLQEGTSTWEVEYQKVMGDLRRLKGLDS
ncbi:MAG: DUF507 family protein [Myxococcales bacterium]|nr:DUF507 family protein [Myxococcales bacterium]